MATTTRTLQPASNTFTSTRQTTSTTPQKAPTPSARPYKDFLTPALHRRFTTAASLILSLCWLETLLIHSSPSYLWRWFPLGPAGLTTLLLFLSCLAVFIIRVQNLHIGVRTTTSAFETAVQLALSPRAWATGVWYLGSALWFGEVYLRGRSAEAGLGWVDVGRTYERARLNENPVFLRVVLGCIAVGQTVVHLVRDADLVALGADEGVEKVDKTTTTAESALPPALASRLPVPLTKLAAQGKDIANRTLLLALCGVTLSLPVYFGLVRRTIWALLYPVARTLYRELPQNAGPGGLTNAPAIFWQALSSSLLLVLLWEVSNAVFSIFTAQPPLKRGQPLTSEIKDARGVVLSRSKDPNGSLLRGLRAKNEVTKSFAFWELCLVCTNEEFALRRKMIFTEVDRCVTSKEGGTEVKTTWKQICELCLAQLTDISLRISAAQQPLQQTDTLPTQQQQQQQQQQQGSLSLLPKIADRGVLPDRPIVLGARSNTLAKNVGAVAKSLGQAPGSQNPVTPRARKAIEWTANSAFSPSTQQKWSQQALHQDANGLMLSVLRSPLGEPLRQTFGRRVCAVAFGVPHSNEVNISHAAQTLARLAVVSLKEDDYGQVSKDVPTIISTFTQTIVDIEAFVAGLQASWTDVEFRDGRTEGRRVEEVEKVLGVLRQGLEKVVLGFGEYADTIGVSKVELRRAREAVGRGRSGK